MTPPAQPPHQEAHVRPPNTYFLFFAGIVLCCIPLVFLVQFGDKYAEAQLPLSILLALGAALITACFQGFVQISLPYLKAGGPLAIMILVLWMANPDAAQQFAPGATADPVNPEAQVTPPAGNQAIALPTQVAQRDALQPIAINDAQDLELAEVESPQTGWIYLGHKSAFGGWTTKHFSGGMPAAGDMIEVDSHVGRPLMSQSPKLEGFRYDFGDVQHKVEHGAQLEVHEVKTVGLGKVWARVTKT